MNITKDQVQHLPPQQGETVALIEFEEGNKRRELLKQAGPYRGLSWLPKLFIFFLFLAPVFFPTEKFGSFLIRLLPLTLWALIQFHASGVNPRLDAVVELLHSDSPADKAKSSAPREH